MNHATIVKLCEACCDLPTKLNGIATVPWGTNSLAQVITVEQLLQPSCPN